MRPSPPPDPVAREARLDEVLLSYLEAAELGPEPDRRAILTRHPDLFDELSDFFADRDAIEPLARPLRSVGWDAALDRLLADLDPPRLAGHLGRLGPYDVVDWLGMGGMGLVFQGHDPTLDRPVAIKVLAPAWAADPDAGRRFSREARSAAAICHPHVVTIHAVGDWRGRPYLVMEYVPGPTLQGRLDEAGPLPLIETLTIALQVASALAAAHAQGLIHRDVKPANILLENGLARARLTDFGLARAVDDARLTQVGTVAGTPQYMAPEQARGEPLDRRADLFSLGGVIYAMCAGAPPFRGSSTPEVLRRVCDEPAPSLRRVQPSVPDWLAAIVARLLRKRPSDRFSSAAEVADLLAQHLARLRDPSLPPIRPRRAPGWAGRLHARDVSLAVSVGLLAGSATVWALLPTRSTGPIESANHPWPTPEPRSAGVAVDLALPHVSPATAGPSATAFIAHPDPGRLARTVRWEFASGPEPILGLRLVGATELPEGVTREPGGLRLDVPRGLLTSVGVEATGLIVGDFEINATLKDLGTATDPPDGHGVGPELAILAPATGAIASIARYQGRSAEGDDLALTLQTTGPDGQPRILGRWVRSGDRLARFRLVRVGSQLHYLVAEGAGPFRDLFRVEFGTDRVVGPRLILDPGHSARGGAVCLQRLTVQAENLPNLATDPLVFPTPTPAPATPAPRSTP